MFPLEESRIVFSGLHRGSCSIFRNIATQARSLTLPVGLAPSVLTNSRTGEPERGLSSTSGVFPTFPASASKLSTDPPSNVYMCAPDE